jgi:hypothetical protein
MPTLRWVVFLCSLGILPAGVAINFLFVRAGMPTLRWVVFLCIEGILPAVALDDTHACKMLFVDARDCAS